MSRLSDVKESWIGCQKCGLHVSRTRVVFSDGPETADIMIVGEGPGATEDAKGIPFCGVSGELFNEILRCAGISRQECYWTNAIRCHPYGNRAPLQPELDACRPLLLAEIEIIKPKVIIMAGQTAARTLMGTTSSMGSIAGKFTNINGIPAIAIYHPAAILRNKDLNPDRYMEYKKSVWASIKAVKKYIDEVRAGKQPEVKAEVVGKQKPAVDSQMSLL